MGVRYLKGERMTGGETTKGKWSGVFVRGGRARHIETSGVEYLERKGVDMTYGSCWFTQTC